MQPEAMETSLRHSDEDPAELKRLYKFSFSFLGELEIAGNSYFISVLWPVLASQETFQGIWA